MTINNKYQLEQMVYLKTDIDQYERLVIGIKVCSKFGLLYYLAFGTQETIHAEIEISPEKNILI